MGLIDQCGEGEISNLDKKLLLHWILSPLQLLMCKYASLTLQFTLLNGLVLPRATELANVILIAEEDKMVYAVVLQMRFACF